jgi:hypothetical protein
MTPTLKSFAASFLFAFATLFAVGGTSAIAPNQAEAGVLKKAKIGLKYVGRGARKLEMASSKWGKVGKVIGKGARGIRKGTQKARRGISKGQKAINRQVAKHCRGKCANALKGIKKLNKAKRRLEREVDRKCRQFGQNSRACEAAKDALELASPI